MTTTTIHPENFGKKAVLQIIESRKIILGAKSEAIKILENAELERTEILTKAYNQGLLHGAKQAHLSLHNSTQFNSAIKSKIENLIIELTKQVLLEVVNEEAIEILKNTISTRVHRELEAYSKQINLEETKISLEISDTLDDLEVDKILTSYPFLNISKIADLAPSTFILRSPYGEIESDPLAYVELISDHLKNFMNLSLSDFINE